MNKTKIILGIICAFVILSHSSSAQVLSKFENYTCAPYPANQYDLQEAYYLDKRNGYPVPPTKVEALICDIYQRIETDLALDVEPSMVTEEMIQKAIDIYISTDWKNIAGNFPWTLSNFIKDLSQNDRELLVREVTQYMLEYGVYDKRKIEYEK